MEIKERVRAMEDELVELRRYFHAHPEPSWKEFNTQKKIMTYLDELGNSQEIEPNQNYKGAIRFNEDHQCLQLCDGYKWKDINGHYKQTSGIVYSLLF